MTLSVPIIGGSVQFDTGVYPSKLSSELSLTNVKQQACIVMPFPTGSDLGIHFSFRVPDNYASDPVLVIRGVIDGTPANTLAFGVVFLARSASDTVDAAYETEDLANNATWTGYANEDEYEETIALTPASAFTPGQTVYGYVYRDDSVDNTTYNFLLNPDTTCFQYTES